MFNSFPQPKPDSGGGLLSPLDWSAYQTVYDWSGTTVSVPATSWGTFLDVNGDGWLMFAQAFIIGFADCPNTRITVDGTPFAFNGFVGGAHTIGNIINHPIYFKKNLKIEVYNRDASARNVGCDYTYLLRAGTPNNPKQSILLAGIRTMALNQVTSLTPTNVVNIAGSGYLLGIEFSGYYATSNGWVGGYLSVDGVTKMNARDVFEGANYAIKLHHFDGPVRFNSSLVVQIATNNAGFNALSRVFYALD